MKRSFSLFWAIALLATLSAVYAAVAPHSSTTPTFVTWNSLEPDKWSSIWLIRRHINSDATIEVHPAGDPLGDGIPFGVPQAEYKRSGTHSAFESLLVGFDQQDAALQRMGRIITAIETTAWSAPSDPEVHIVEQSFRRLQDRYGRAYVPIGCYGHFFDVLYTQLANDTESDVLSDALNEAVENQSCEQFAAMAERMQAKRVKEIAIDQLLSEIALSKDVVFVDTREPAEFQRSHIPGAINIPMRDLDQSVYNQLKNVDRVISYCVKDFRGYEVARMMLEHGVSNVAVMKPHGLAGWQSVGLPVTSGGLTEAAAEGQLRECARDQETCLWPAS